MNRLSTLRRSFTEAQKLSHTSMLDRVECEWTPLHCQNTYIYLKKRKRKSERIRSNIRQKIYDHDN